MPDGLSGYQFRRRSARQGHRQFQQGSLPRLEEVKKPNIQSDEAASFEICGEGIALSSYLSCQCVVSRDKVCPWICDAQY